MIYLDNAATTLQKPPCVGQAMLDALEVGDSIETSGGLFGVVIDVSGDILIVEFGGDRHCRIPMRKTAVVSIEKANSTEE